MNPKLLACFMALMVMVWLGASADAAEIIVGQTPGATTIQAAVDMADGGDTIIIPAGTYNGSVYISNYDADDPPYGPDHRWNGPNDKDYSGLKIIGENKYTTIVEMTSIPMGTCGSYSDEPYCPRWENGVWNFNSPFIFQAGRINNAKMPKPGANGPYYMRGTTLANGEPRYNMGYQGHYQAWVNHPNTTNPDVANLPFVTGIVIKNLTFKNGYSGIYVEGCYKGMVIEDCVFENCYFGINLRHGGEQNAIRKNEFKNCKFGVGIQDNVAWTRVVNNKFTLNDNINAMGNVSGRSLYAEGNPFIGCFLNGGEPLDSSLPLHGYSSYNTFSKNTFDYSAYTLSKEVKAFEFQGGKQNARVNNTVKYANMVEHSNSAFTNSNPQEDMIEGYMATNCDQGIFTTYIDDVSLTDSSFKQFANPAAGSGWSQNGSIWEANSTPNSAQYLTLEVTLPLTGVNTLAFDHAFNITRDGVNPIPNGWETSPYCELGYGEVSYSTDGGSTWTRLKANTDDSTMTAYTRYCWCTKGQWLVAEYDLTGIGDGSTPTLVRFTLDDSKGNWSCTNDYSVDPGWYIDNIAFMNDTNILSYNTSTTTEFNQYALWFSNRDGGPGGTSVTESVFTDSLGDGIVYGDDTAANRVIAGSNMVNDNDIYNNAGYGLWNYQSTINAENNWWGDSSGPTIASNASGTGDAIYDPNSGVDYDPWTLPAQADDLNSGDGIEVGGDDDPGDTDVKDRVSCQPGTTWEMGVFAGDLASLLGSLNCTGKYLAANPTYTDGSAYGSPGDILLKFTASNAAAMPKFKDGDFFVVNTATERIEAFLPSNQNGEYGDYLLLWVDSDGTTYYACDPADRHALAPDVTLDEAKSDPTNYLAKDVGVVNYGLTETAGSDFNWVGAPFFRTDVDEARELWNKISVDSGGGSVLRTISKWNPISQTYTQYSTVPFEMGNFMLTRAGAYRVEMSTNGQLNANGAVLTPSGVAIEVKSTQGSDYTWFTIPDYRSDLVFASDLVTDVQTKTAPPTIVRSVSMWNTVGQQYVQYTTFPPVGNFEIEIGTPVRVEVTSNAIYTPDL